MEFGVYLKSYGKALKLVNTIKPVHQLRAPESTYELRISQGYRSVFDPSVALLFARPLLEAEGKQTITE